MIYYWITRAIYWLRASLMGDDNTAATDICRRLRRGHIIVMGLIRFLTSACCTHRGTRCEIITPTVCRLIATVRLFLWCFFWVRNSVIGWNHSYVRMCVFYVAFHRSLRWMMCEHIEQSRFERIPRNSNIANTINVHRIGHHVWAMWLKCNWKTIGTILISGICWICMSTNCIWQISYWQMISHLNEYTHSILSNAGKVPFNVVKRCKSMPHDLLIWHTFNTQNQNLLFNVHSIISRVNKIRICEQLRQSSSTTYIISQYF